MDVRMRITVAAFCGVLAVACATLALAQEPFDELSAVDSVQLKTDSYVTVGRVGRQRGRFTLQQENGSVTAYLSPRKSLDLAAHVGRTVSLTVREMGTPIDGKPRLWVEQVTSAEGREPGLLSEARGLSQSYGEWALAQYSEPVMETATLISEETHPAICGPPDWLWFDAQYLFWKVRGMGIPPLVTTSPLGTPRDEAGVLGQPGTRVLFGEQDILNQTRSGARLKAGFWLDRANLIGVEGELLWLTDDTTDFLASCDGTGTPILARPFFNINPRNPFTLAFDPPAREDAQLVCFPDDLRGVVGVSASTRLYGAGLALRANLACDNFGVNCETHYSRVDLLGGYRYLYLKDQLLITEQLASLGTAAPVTFDIYDSFDTRNEFHGLDLGMSWRVGYQRWWFELLLRSAFGNANQVVNIQGASTITDPQASTTYSGGLLAQDSNIGTYSRNRFAVVPEVGVTLGYQVIPHWNLTIGYTLLHWSAVVRPGDQIDLDVNPDQLPPPIDPLAGPLRPAFSFEESAFWAQGLHAGIEGRW